MKPRSRCRCSRPSACSRSGTPITGCRRRRAAGTAGTAAPTAAGPGASRALFPPEKLGELEGPDRDLWQKPDQVMDALGIADGSTVADLGAGGGWFTVRLARRVGPQGVVYAEDIQEQMLESIDRRVKREGLRNVRMVLGASDDPKLPAQRLDAVLIVDVYHEVTQPVEFLRNVKESLTQQGRLGIVEFKRDGGGPGAADGGTPRQNPDVVKFAGGRRLQADQPRDVPVLPVPADLRQERRPGDSRRPTALASSLLAEELPRRRAARRRRGGPSTMSAGMKGATPTVNAVAEAERLRRTARRGGACRPRR